MNKLVHLIVSISPDFPQVPSYYVSEPGLLRDGSGMFAGGFDSSGISDAITFDNIVLAHLERKRLADIYSDISSKISVKTMTTKELFKAKLGG